MLMVIDLSWIFHMLEHEVDGKDVHVLEDSPNSNPPAHCQVSDDDDLLFYFLSDPGVPGPIYGSRSL